MKTSHLLLSDKAGKAANTIELKQEKIDDGWVSDDDDCRWGDDDNDCRWGDDNDDDDCGWGGDDNACIRGDDHNDSIKYAALMMMIIVHKLIMIVYGLIIKTVVDEVWK